MRNIEVNPDCKVFKVKGVYIIKKDKKLGYRGLKIKISMGLWLIISIVLVVGVIKWL